MDCAAEGCGRLAAVLDEIWSCGSIPVPERRRLAARVASAAVEGRRAPRCDGDDDRGAFVLMEGALVAAGQAAGRV